MGGLNLKRLESIRIPEVPLLQKCLLYGVLFPNFRIFPGVEIVYEKFSIRKNAMINILGTVFFLLPLALLVATGSVGFVMDAYTMGEISEDPGGLTHRWIIKFMIPLSFVFLIFSSIGYVLRNINLYRGAK